jgi:hypothetical protein
MLQRVDSFNTDPLHCCPTVIVALALAVLCICVLVSPYNLTSRYTDGSPYLDEVDSQHRQREFPVEIEFACISMRRYSSHRM